MKGIGAMIAELGGNEDSAKAVQLSTGKKLSEIKLEPETGLFFTFDDGSRLQIFDDGQSCCERRYMATGDDLKAFVGAQFLGGTIKNAPTIEDQDGEHEVQFLEITTSKGVFTMSNHNEHNGYYGGFAIRAKLL